MALKLAIMPPENVIVYRRLDKGVNLITSPNGSGKTNILRSIYLLRTVGFVSNKHTKLSTKGRKILYGLRQNSN